MNISRMSDQGAVETLNEICDAMCLFVKDNPELEEQLLQLLREEVISDIDDDSCVEPYPPFHNIQGFCNQVKSINQTHPKNARFLLEDLVKGVLDPLAEDDFWGTEGWEHRFGME